MTGDSWSPSLDLNAWPQKNKHEGQLFGLLQSNMELYAASGVTPLSSTAVTMCAQCTPADAQHPARTPTHTHTHSVLLAYGSHDSPRIFHLTEINRYL
jgi:hypothetical protein